MSECKHIPNNTNNTKLSSVYFHMFKKKGVWGWSQQLAELFASSCVHRPLLDSADQEPIIAAPRQEWSVPGDSGALQEGHCFLQHVLKLAVVLHRPYAWVLHQPGQPQRIIKGIASVFQYYLFVVFIFCCWFFLLYLCFTHGANASNAVQLYRS